MTTPRSTFCPLRRISGVNLTASVMFLDVSIRPTRDTGYSFVVPTVAPVAFGWNSSRVGFTPTGEAPPYHSARQDLSPRGRLFDLGPASRGRVVVPVKDGVLSRRSPPTAPQRPNESGARR